MHTFTSRYGGSPRILVAWRSPAMCETKQVRDETVSDIEHSQIIFHSTLHSASSYALAERPSKASSGGNRQSFQCSCSSYALAERPSKASSGGNSLSF